MDNEFSPLMLRNYLPPDLRRVARNGHPLEGCFRPVDAWEGIRHHAKYLPRFGYPHVGMCGFHLGVSRCRRVVAIQECPQEMVISELLLSVLELGDSLGETLSMRVVGLLIVPVGPFACTQDEAAQELGIEDTSTAQDISAERHADVQPEEQDISGLDIQEPQSPPFQELIDMGLADYLGQAVVDEVTVEDGVTTTKFTVESGPICLRGAPYSMSTHSGPSDELLIFLGGEGPVGQIFCAAFDKAPPGIPNGEVLNPELEANPFRTFDMAFLPYCDGSLFAGDATHDDDDDGG